MGALGVVGVIAGFTGYLLAMCMYDSVPRGSSRALAAGRRLRDSYAGVGAASFGETGRKFVRAVQVLVRKILVHTHHHTIAAATTTTITITIATTITITITTTNYT